MAILSDLLSLLNRPVATSGKPAPRGKKLVPDAPSVTEEELVAALDRMGAERAAAFSVIETAGDRRESLLLTEGSDDEILGLDREVDLANLTLERMDKLEPQLRARLKALRDSTRRARWIELRGSYLAVGLVHLEALRRTNLDHEAFAEAWAAVTFEFPDAAQVLPPFPLLPKNAADEFEAELKRFSHLAYDPNPAPASLYQWGAQPGTSSLGGLQALADRAEVTIEVLTGHVGADGKWMAKGGIVTLPGPEAYHEVIAGRAREKENT